jgi:hypothetical protein
MASLHEPLCVGRSALRCVLLLALLPGLGPRAAHAAGGLVPKAQLLNLLLAPGEVPRRVFLSYLEAAPKDPSAFRLSYFGEKGSGYFVHVAVCIYPSVQAAREGCRRYANSFQAPADEITGMRPVSEFSDLAFGYGEWAGKNPAPTAIRYCRANVSVEVSVDSRQHPALACPDLLQISRTLTRRVDLAAAGRPSPVPFLPALVMEIVRYDKDAIRSWETFAQRTWGRQGMSIALLDRYGIPRLFPARRIGAHDYLVPLTPVAKFLAAWRNASGDELKQGPAAWIGGKLLTFRDGSTVVTVNGAPYRAAAPVWIMESHAIGPLSLLEHALGAEFAWTERDGIPIARLPKERQ